MVDKLGQIESLKLFQQHAFGFGSQPDDTDGIPFRFGSDTRKQLSDEILSLADGLPLALQIYGSVVRTKYEVEEWREFIEELKESPKEEIQDRLVISYNAIDRTELKKMFLDIACFFVGWQKERVFEILETYYPYVNVKINSLKGRCLLTIDKNVLHMHDLLRDMGMEVARNKSLGNPAKYSRLWLSTDIHRVLMEETEDLEAIEGIYYTKNKVTSGQVPITMETFKRMKNLRFLHLDGFEFDHPTGSFYKKFRDLRWLCWKSCPLPSFPPETFRDLRWLCWKSCPLLSFPPDFKPINLGILELRGSIMQSMEPSMVFQKLKILNMAYSPYLATTPDFNMLPCLVTINFEHCTNLKQIHISIGGLAGLVSLNLRHCVKLASLPKTIGNLKALLHLDVSHCHRLVEFPEELVNIESLEKLQIGGPNCVKNLPHLIHLLSNLIELDASLNTILLTLPDNICKLRSLEILNVDSCYDLEALPIELGNITSLKVLDMTGTSVSDLPVSIGNLSNLVKLTLSHNSNLKNLPDTICNLRSLEILIIYGCEKLEELPGQMWKLTSLSKLVLGKTTLLKVESSQIPLSLKTLDLSENVFTALPLGISRLSNLESLNLERCSKLLSIEELPLNLKELNARHCSSIKIFRAILKQLEILNLECCRDLEEIQGLDQLTSVNLFHFKECRKLWSITGFPPNLKRIIANDCSSLKRLPNLSNLKRVEVMDLRGCVGLTEIQDLEELSSIRELRLGGCSLSLLQHIFTKRFFQTCSGFQNVIGICLGANTILPSWMSQLRDSKSRRRVWLDLTPSTSHNFLGTILCFESSTYFHSSLEDTYSIKNITSGFIWSDHIYKYDFGRCIIIVPKSIFLVKNDDHRIEFTTEKGNFLAVHLLYDD